MTRKDFILIAETIRFSMLSPENRKQLAADFADSLRGTNSNFDKERFIEAATRPTKAG